MKIDAKAFALSGGIICAVMIFLTTLLSLGTEYAKEFLQVLVSVYPGYDITGAGSVIGALYAFVDAFVFLFLFAWVYNMFVK